MIEEAEIVALGDVELFSVPQHVANHRADDLWEAVVAAIPSAELATRGDEDIADTVIDTHRPPLAFAVGTPRYEGSTPDAAPDAIDVTYSVPFEGDMAVLTGAAMSSAVPAHLLRATIDGQRVLFSYRIPVVGSAAVAVAERFERSHQHLLSELARRKKRTDDARTLARAHVMRLLRDRRAQERGERTLDQELQARLDDYLGR